MRIAITTMQAPFVSGGAEFLATNLKEALIQYGHEAEIVTMPFMDNPLNLIEDHIIASRLFDLTNSWAGKIDLCIGLKFPAYYIPHPNKVIWALHQHRAAYDLFNTEFSNIKKDENGKQIQNVIYNADNLYLKEAKRVYTISNNVTNRMSHYNNIFSEPLYHPCPDMGEFYCGNFENYILMPSRINITKRQMLALEAMTYSKENTKLYIMGKADNPLEKDNLLRFVKEKKLQNKVKFFDYVTQEEKFKLYANARAVMFIPMDEDYGYITLEAMAASKAILTAKDSGGSLEFVKDEYNGFVVKPTPKEIGEMFDVLAGSEKLAIEMGKNSKKRLQDMNITWNNVVKELTK